jgi:endonuclease/exonuclease/phosphatase family metal-dependent hydrolase
MTRNVLLFVAIGLGVVLADGALAHADNAWPNRVAMFNVCNPCGVHDRPAVIAAAIAKYKPHVIGLAEICVKETNQIRDILNKKYGLDYHVVHGSVLEHLWRCGGTPWDPGNFGNAILSAAPMTAVVHYKYKTSSSEARGFTAVTTDIAGQQIRVFVTHLAQGGQGRARQGQVKELLSSADHYTRAVVLGDFNAEPSTPEIRTMGTFLFHDADDNCGPPPNSSCKPTANASPHRKKFDYIFLKGIKPPGNGVHDTYSDHDLVHADLHLASR